MSLFVSTSCNILAGGGDSSSQGSCTTASGVVDTYTIFGTWKQITGYDVGRSTAELELNYNVLVLLTGTTFCVVEVVNGEVPAANGTIAKGTYTHDVTKKTLALTYDDTSTGGLAGTTADVSYSFSGTCDKTKMTLTDKAASTTSSSTVQYQVRSKSLQGVSCTGTN